MPCSGQKIIVSIGVTVCDRGIVFRSVVRGGQGPWQQQRGHDTHDNVTPVGRSVS